MGRLKLPPGVMTSDFLFISNRRSIRFWQLGGVDPSATCFLQEDHPSRSASNVTLMFLILQDAQNKLRDEQNMITDKEQQFEKELAVAQKLVNLHKSHCHKRTAEAAELESVVRDLRKHIEVHFSQTK